MNINSNGNEIKKRLSKYIFVFVCVFVSATFIPSQPLKQIEKASISLIACISFAMIDIMFPTISNQSQLEDIVTKLNK